MNLRIIWPTRRCATFAVHRSIRRQTVERVFGTLKGWMGPCHLLTKRIKNVATEMSLSVLAYNIKRMISIIGVKPLIAAIRA
ncbi:transposase [Sphingorhabdus sp. YGSMI21]|uniref:transposase n=1 Tax=Sphingorhabdus sp. YGSMI21 TaxID=2077182 RepID=UPI001F0B7780|nr:transposase [Sphingorhabdus sp. YGSMI21]